MKPSILLSFDVEEFDMPLEYDCSIALSDQLRLGKAGLTALQPLLQRYTSTLFTTAQFAMAFPEQIKVLAQDHELASHTFYHSQFENAHLRLSRETLEAISGQAVTGLRMPRLRPVDMAEVKAAGYAYDASVNPTFLPGRYNNLHLPRTLFEQEGMKRIPAAVSPHFRLPLFWLAFKNMPYALYLRLCRQCLEKDGCLSLYFHPWEFTDVRGWLLPGYTIRWCGPELLERLQRLLKDLSPHGEFQRMDTYAAAHPLGQSIAP